jgi:hypothetical protein
MEYPRDDLWERKPYESLIADGSLTTFFRPGDRVNQNNKKHFKKGETLTIRILEKPGDEERGLVPVLNGHIRKARVADIYKKNIENLTSEDFKGSSPDVQDVLQLRYNLGITYNRPVELFKEITVVKVEYLDKGFEDVV